MKEAFECLDKANFCDRLARQAGNASSTRVLSGIAEQWRRLAHDTDRHKRQISRATHDERYETAPRNR